MNSSPSFNSFPGKAIWARLNMPEWVRNASLSRRYQAFTPGKGDGKGGTTTGNNAGRTPEEQAEFIRKVQDDLRIINEQRAKDAILRAAAAEAEAERERKRARFFNKVLDWLVETGRDVALLPLIPFISLMRKALGKAGKSEEGDIKEVVQRFYETFVSQFLPKKEIAISLTAIVSAVVAYISSLLKSKDDGQDLTKTEEFIVENVRIAEAKIGEIAEGEIDNHVGKTVREAATGVKTSGIFGIILVVVVLVLGLRFFKVIK